MRISFERGRDERSGAQIQLQHELLPGVLRMASTSNKVAVVVGTESAQIQTLFAAMTSRWRAAGVRVAGVDRRAARSAGPDVQRRHPARYRIGLGLHDLSRQCARRHILPFGCEGCRCRMPESGRSDRDVRLGGAEQVRQTRSDGKGPGQCICDCSRKGQAGAYDYLG